MQDMLPYLFFPVYHLQLSYHLTQRTCAVPNLILDARTEKNIFSVGYTFNLDSLICHVILEHQPAMKHHLSLEEDALANVCVWGYFSWCEILIIDHFLESPEPLWCSSSVVMVWKLLTFILGSS
jgi:hypothetical protein